MNPYEKQKIKLISSINKKTDKKKFKYKVSRDERFEKTFVPNYSEEIIILNAIDKKVEDGIFQKRFQEGEMYIDYKIIK